MYRFRSTDSLAHFAGFLCLQSPSGKTKSILLAGIGDRRDQNSPICTILVQGALALLCWFLNWDPEFVDHIKDALASLAPDSTLRSQLSEGGTRRRHPFYLDGSYEGAGDKASLRRSAYILTT
jgi:hypothetical protein